jgi:CubicO group peptidase (beta-lactamase class C family)
MTPRALPLVFPLLLPLLSSCATAPAAAPCTSSTTAGLVATASAITPAAPSPPAASPPPAGPALPARFDLPAIDAYLEAQVAARGYVGLSVAIVRDGAVVLEKAYGRARLAPDAPATPETPFAVGSITKQFVSSIALQLISEHKLALDDKVARWFPDLTRAKDITVHDLLTHVSGYRDSYPLDYVDLEMQQAATPDEIISRYGKRPLDFEPRSRFSYTNTGYKIVGRILEKVTKRTLADLLAERIFRPLGLTHTSFEPADGTPSLARGYTSFALGAPEPAKPEAPGWSYGPGGIWSTAGDIARWSLSLMGGKVLDARAYETLTTPRTLSDGRVTGYGCGIGVDTRNGERVLSHDGGQAGFVSYAVMVPRTKTVVVALSNRDDAGPWGLVDDLVSLLLEDHRPPPPTIPGAPLKQVASEVFAMLQSGNVDRTRLSDDFNDFLTDEKVKGAVARLGPLGTPTDVSVRDVHERGGMEQSSVRFTFPTVRLRASVFRSTDGKVQQFLIEKP